MKLSDKLYHWFYKKREFKNHGRILPNMLEGFSTGFLIWFFSMVFDRFVGLNATLYLYLPHLAMGGAIIGAIIGMISNEILWHKEKMNHGQKN